MKRDKLKQAVLKSHVLISENWTKDTNIKMSRALFHKVNFMCKFYLGVL